MKYFLILLLLFPLLANAQVMIVPEDDAYSPKKLQNQPNQNLLQEPAPEDVEEAPQAEIVLEPPLPEQQEPAPIAVEMIETKKAVLQILDKINASVAELEVEIDKEQEYNELKIEVKRCIRSPQESKEENLGFMRIWDIRQGDYTNIVFSGWMFSSNPALHSFEHPIYDIVLISCAD